MSAALDLPEPERLILPFRPLSAAGEPTAGELTLRQFYDAHTRPESAGLADATLALDRQALAYWERDTPNRPIGEVERGDVQQLLDGLRTRGSIAKPGEPLKDATINRVWRHVAKIFSHAVELRFLSAVPTIGRRMRSKLVHEAAKHQREPVTFDELERIWRGCAQARYPRRGSYPAPKQWRVAEVLFALYGARTEDTLGLTWEDVRFGEKLIRFQAMKNRKVQGLPLTELVAAHLRSIRPFAASPTTRVFPGFKSRGHWDARLKNWKPGYYTTWRNEILPAAGIDDGGLLFKHFREAAVTRYNGIEPGLGSWIAGHSVPGVTAQFYDLPTKRIREAIEEQALPDCFREVDGTPPKPRHVQRPLFD